ncbi:MAG: hypothetical protein QM664_03890 [Flavihumibacter sp.]
MKSYHPLIAWILLPALYLLPVTAGAQQNDSSLSLKQALQFALTNKADIRKAGSAKKTPTTRSKKSGREPCHKLAAPVH